MPYEVWIDRGGTFTDCVGFDRTTGEVRVAKVLSSDGAPLEGIRRLLALPPDAPIPPCDVRMGTTLATNALLERKGAPTGLLITQGLEDLLLIGDQSRPDLFALCIRTREPLHRATCRGLAARISAGGEVLARPRPAELPAMFEYLRRAGCSSLAVVVIHAHRNDSVEREIAAAAREWGFAHVSASHEVASEMGLLARGDTTVADAYLTPIIRAYIDRLTSALPGSELSIMQSSGGLAPAARFRGRDSVLSGPAGGVVACAYVARAAGLARAIGFDMGGTSTDVSRWAGDFERTYETEVAGVRMRAPAIAVHTVAAGGGSVCRFDGRRFTVGPESAGADPGPLCYGRPEARELALTDINLALGRVTEDRFPFPLERARVDGALDAIAARSGRLRLDVAEGFFRVAIESMAAAIRRITVEKGHDVRDFALVVFGGAGGQHACALARRLGIRTLVFHPMGGVLSAFGMGVAPTTWHGELDAALRELAPGLLAELEPAFAELERSGRAAIGATDARRRIDLRYRGTETSLSIDVDTADDETRLRAAFEALHLAELGYVRPDHPVEAVTARVELVAERDPPHLPAARATVGAEPIRWARLRVDGVDHDAPVYLREELPGAPLDGPAIVLEETGTIVVEPGFTLRLEDERLIVRASGEALAIRERATTDVDPVLLEIFANLFMSIAEQMGTVLRRTALSTNIRDRLDFSCAVFDRDGGLVANAPHIPVHLGAMGESVRAVRAAHPSPEPGDVYVTNDPATGGSHLPDVTVVTPVHDARGALLFYTASRGHHADIGGITPGSMPPFSRRLDEEGVVLRSLRIVHGGRFDRDALRARLCAGPHPARRPDDNVADVEAQIAANRRGERLLVDLSERYGRDVVEAYMQHVQDNAAARVADAIECIPDGEHRFEDAMDDGTTIRVCLRVSGRTLSVDFEGTGAQVDGNLNAPRAVTIAAVLYVMRCLVGEAIPLNGGCLRPVTIRIPEGSILAPDPDRAVAGGNVETSQRVVDVLLGALGRLAASQGTMNNLTFGDESFGYYETVAGGSGAAEGCPGASAVHTHMTNSRLTDPEVLETRFPVRLTELSIRRGSGGRGRWPGGDGIVRELEALRPLRLSILSERRTRAPFGLAGGEPGTPGKNRVGDRDVGGKVELDVPAGARVRIETPGGGGYGKPS